MRKPKYLSPSSMSKFYEDRREFYIRYLCDHRTARPPQKDFMAVGSGFDALCKHNIYEDFFGRGSSKGGQYELETIFEAQVEPHVRDVARERGVDLFNQYQDSGAYASLVGDVLKSKNEPEMEFSVQGTIDGVPLLGKPDLRYITKEGVHVVCDWKVMGSCSAHGASPYHGYQIVRDSYNSTTHGKPYRAPRRKADAEDMVYVKDYRGEAFRDVEVQDRGLEMKNEDWANQLTIYAWLMGEAVCSEDFVVRMEQVCCRQVKSRKLPRAKFATHMNKVSPLYQSKLLANLKMCWATIESGHIFDHLSRADSDEMIELLDRKAQTPIGIHPALAKLRR